MLTGFPEAQRLLDGGSTMKRFRQRKSWIVLIAVLFLFAACKGESPTAPPPGGGNPTPPPSGVNVAVTVSNTTPLVDSSVTVTATVTNNGQPVPNGTAVEFSTTAGTLDNNGTSIVKTTNGGVATVTLTSGSTGLVRVTVVVNNVTRTQEVNFLARPVTPPPPNTTPSITSVAPTVGRPQGGEVIRITGTNFNAPVRVLFNTGGATAVEASVQSVTATSIEVVTPPVNLGAGQQLIADIIVLTQAGSAGEQRVEVSDAFTFRSETLVPRISTITPNSGPVTGGTRVTIFGDGFQEPVQVLFNTAEAKVLNVQFDRINVETPAGRDTDPNGQGPVTGPVTVTVRNINSQTEDTMGAGFHYKAAMQIVGVTVNGNASTAGGTRVTIEGQGFVAPLIVVVETDQGNIGLTQISVTGTKIVAITPTIAVTNCGEDLEGPIVVTNIDNGDQAEGPTFTFDVLEPAIVNISPTSITVGTDTSFTVTVLNPVPGVTRFQVGTKTVFPTGAVDNGNGSVTFTLPVPANIDFPTEDCGTGGSRATPIDLDITYAPAAEGCEDTVEEALTVNPADTSCVLPPTPDVNVLIPVPPACLVINTLGPVTPANGTIRLENTGNAPLTVTAAASPATFTILPAVASIPAGLFQDFTVTFTPAGVDVAGNAAFTTNDTDEPTVNVCLTGNVP